MGVWAVPLLYEKSCQPMSSPRMNRKLGGGALPATANPIANATPRARSIEQASAAVARTCRSCAGGTETVTRRAMRGDDVRMRARDAQ